MGRDSERELGDPPAEGAGESSIEGRLSALEAAVEEVRRRQVVADLRSHPAHLLYGVAETRRIQHQDLDDLAETLARWDVPLSPAEELELQQVSSGWRRLRTCSRAAPAGQCPSSSPCGRRRSFRQSKRPPSASRSSSTAEALPGPLTVPALRAAAV